MKDFRKWWVLAGSTLLYLSTVADGPNFNVAIPAIQDYFEASVGQIQLLTSIAALCWLLVPWEPFIRYPQGLADYVTRFVVALRIQHYEAQFRVIYEFFRRLQERYRQEGITIPFPFAAELDLVRGSEPAQLSHTAPENPGG